MTRDKVFISYSHKDKSILDRLLIHLGPDIKAGLNTWSDKDIQPGQQWPSEIENSLSTASVAVLLLSADFLASDFIQDREVPRFLEPAKLGQITILPVLISACRWADKAIARFQSPIDFKKPLKDLKGNKREEAFVAIAEAIQAAWVEQGYSRSFPEEEASRTALADLRNLADRHAAMTADLVEACFRRAVRECHGDTSIEELFPQLTALQSLGWPQLIDFFNDRCRPDPALVQALERQLSAPVPQALSPVESSSYLALVLQRAGSRARDTRYYSWSAFVAEDGKDGYQEPIVLESLEHSRNQVVFDNPLEKETAIATVLHHLLAWAARIPRLWVLEIFAPTELLDAPWSELVVENDNADKIPLLESIAYVLRPLDRLEESFNAKRLRLQRKIQKLAEGNGKWCVGADAMNPRHLRSVLIEQDHHVALKRPQPLPEDGQQRDSWFGALIHSMVPIAIWYRHGSKGSEDEWSSHLKSYETLSGHEDGGQACRSCLNYEASARKRKELCLQPLAKQLVFMFDHWERTPKITPQDRGATRATSPSLP